MKLLLLVALVCAAACVSASAAPEAQALAAPSAIKPLSFWDKVKHDAEEVAKKVAEELAKKAAEELAERLAEAAAAALLGGVDAPNQHDLQRHSIIEQINSIPNNPWVAGMNTRFAGKPVDAIKRQLGVKFNGNKLPLKMHPKKTLAELPASFDAREAWPKCPTIGEIRDQSDCGSCWAFGAVEAASDRICIDTNGAVNAHLSAEVMTGCCWECGAGCDGGDPGTAWMFLTNPGVQTGGNYGDYSWCSAYSLPNCDHHVSGQYQPCGANEYPTPACPTACDKNSTYNTPFNKDAHIFNNSYSVSSDPTQIMQEIMTEGPVEAAFTVYADFEHYKSGVYVQQSQQELGGHAIKILGWGTDSASGLPYWIVANSWNTDWGNKGYFWIVRGRDECGIEDNVVAGTYSA